MRWHQGPIPAAIGEAKQNNAVFVIYVEGEDDLSKSMTATWEDGTVKKACQEAGFVGMKLTANSEACVQFSQIYPVVCIPSTFFIGDNGVPLEVVGGSLPVNQFLERIQKVIQLHQNKDQVVPPAPAPVVETPPPPQLQEPTPPTPSQPEVAPPMGSGDSETVKDKTEEPAQTEKTEEKAKENTDSAGTVVEDGPAEPSTSEAAAVSTEEEKQKKLERAKRLIEERREAKRQEEIEEEKRKEQERRRQGQEMVKARQTTQERQAKARAEEIRKAKEEERLARERVREQIARDREERAARYKQEKEEREQAQLVREQERAAEEASRQAARSEFARLQFRLPDGSSVTNTFASSDSLETARQFVAEHLQLQSFAMATTFPRRQFTDADMASSLMDLGLAPSAALVVLPSKPLKENVALSPNGPSEAVTFQARSGASIVSSGGSGGIMDMVWLVLSPLAALWRFLHTFLFGTPQNPSRPANTPQPPPRQEQATFSNSPTGGEVKRRRVQPEEDVPRGVSKREGNVIRFSPQQDPDDDQNTYNGNSTQQM
ncbi:UBX domain-containing protein 4-like isoform X2 [Branchiostoma floridae]|uniref:UBX domain-containing protein 4 n=1 Tax=Branchiostoma floridae TaxID=7739 RepID=A0A9J7HE53_BRAFL|nr:UBX domain-containing protein 4-like isoform X2 [Branchiostoma floridae]